MYSLLFQYGGPHRTFNSNVKHGENGVFIFFLFTPFADIVLFFLNRKKRQCNKNYNEIPTFKMSDVKNIYFFSSVYFRCTIPNT